MEARAEIKHGEKLMKKTNTTKPNWFTDNPFFVDKEAYDRFANTMMELASEGDLPCSLEHEEPESLTMQDIKKFSQRFKQDTGLSIEFSLMTCNHCDRLHCLIIVNESEENEMEE